MAAIGEEDSSGQEVKKNTRWERIGRRGGHEVPRGFEPRSLDSESRSANRYTTDQLMEVTGRVT